MAPSITPELRREFTAAALAACPPGQTTNGETLRALLERQSPPQPGDPGETEVRLRTRLEQDPTDLETLCALDRLQGYRDSMVEVLQRRLELAVDHDERWRLLVRLGLLYIASDFGGGLRSIVESLAAMPQSE